MPLDGSRAAKPWIPFNKQPNPDLDKGMPLTHHRPPAQETDGECSQGIDDQVPHCVRQALWVAEHGFLHICAEQLVHAELEDFPESSYRNGKSEREECYEPREHVDIDPFVLVEHVHRRKPRMPISRPDAACRAISHHQIRP